MSGTQKVSGAARSRKSQKLSKNHPKYFLFLTALLVLILIFGRRRKGILRRKSPKEIGSTR